MYAVIFTHAGKKDLKRLPREVSAYIKSEFLPKLKVNPYCGEKLQGVLKNFWKLRFKLNNINYRIIYEIYRKKLLTVVVKVGTRENIYKELRKRIK